MHTRFLIFRDSTVLGWGQPCYVVTATKRPIGVRERLPVTVVDTWASSWLGRQASECVFRSTPPSSMGLDWDR